MYHKISSLISSFSVFDQAKLFIYIYIFFGSDRKFYVRKLEIINERENNVLA